MKEEFRLTKTRANGTLRAFIIKDHGFIVIQVPSLGLSGYGKTVEEAKELVDVAVSDFFNSLIELKQYEIEAFLSKLGWDKKMFSNKNFSKSYIDKEGIIQNLNIDEKSYDELEEMTLSV